MTVTHFSVNGRMLIFRPRLPLAAQKFADGAPCLIDGHIRVGACAGIGVGDGDPAERLPADDPGLLFFFPDGIE